VEGSGARLKDGDEGSEKERGGVGHCVGEGGEDGGWKAAIVGSGVSWDRLSWLDVKSEGKIVLDRSGWTTTGGWTKSG